MAEDPPKPVTREELKALLADRMEDPPLYDEQGRLGEWMTDPTHPDRRHAMQRERVINTKEKRLDAVKQKLELDWDTSS